MSRIKIVLGTAEIEYEGEQEFIENRLIGLLRDLIELRGVPVDDGSSAILKGASVRQSAFAISTNTIAQSISAKTGADLVIASMAKLLIIDGRDVASRQDILEEMKQATTYYKDSYASNLSSYLGTLVRSGRANLVAKSTYSLTAAERQRLQSTIDVLGSTG